MARKAAQQEVTDINLNEGAIQQASTALNTLGELQIQAKQNAQALAVEFAYHGELTEAALEDEIRFYQRRTAEACLELGKRLLLLKELTPHGQFASKVETLGIHDRMARRFMSAAVKFSKSDFKSVLKAAGSQTKLLELAILDDDDITVLNEGGTVKGLELDAIRSMGVTQLRQAVRELEHKVVAKDKVAATKNAKIDELTEALSHPFVPKPDALAKTQEEASALKALAEAVCAMEVDCARLALLAGDLSMHEREAIRERAKQAVQYVVLNLREVVIANNVEVQLDEEAFGGRPAWLMDSQ